MRSPRHVLQETRSSVGDHRGPFRLAPPASLTELGCIGLMKRAGLAILLLFVLCAAVAAKPKPSIGWKRYSGTWFDIFYPQAFTPDPLQESSTSNERVDFAAFLSPAHKVEFYVFSPQWSGPCLRARR